MASNTQGIQRLLAAEKKAADKVGEARKRNYIFNFPSNFRMKISWRFVFNILHMKSIMWAMSHDRDIFCIRFFLNKMFASVFDGRLSQSFWRSSIVSIIIYFFPFILFKRKLPAIFAFDTFCYACKLIMWANLRRKLQFRLRFFLLLFEEWFLFPKKSF